MKTWEAGWEIEFPASTPVDLLLALVVRDLAHGTSYDVEVVEDGSGLAVDFVAADELEGEVYRLLLSAEIAGTQDTDRVQTFTAEMLEELVEEAQDLVARRTELGTRPLSDLTFRPVPEAEERWDLVVPDWLAPERAEVPFGFRSFDRSSEDPWPGNDLLDAHGRVIAVPFAGALHAFGIPAPTDSEHDEADGGTALPLHPAGT